MAETLSAFWVTSAKTLLTQNRTIETFQNCGNLDFHMYLFAFMEVIICKPDMFPEM